jgi:adenylate kinase
MINLILIGPPGAGKGTIAKIISKEYNIPHISTGDIFREVANRDDELGRFIKNELDRGNLIDDQITNEIVNERLKESDCNNGYILDGYPRSLNQAMELDKINNDEIVIFLDISEEETVKRILGRLICPTCKANYNENTEQFRPKNKDICDICQTKLIRRGDDEETAIRVRFENYMEVTKPLIDYYNKKGSLYTVDGNMCVTNILNQVRTIIDNNHK